VTFRAAVASIILLAAATWCVAEELTFGPGPFTVPPGSTELRVHWSTGTTGATVYYPEETWDTNCGWCYICEPPINYGSSPGIPPIPPNAPSEISIVGPTGSVIFQTSGSVTNTAIPYANPCEPGRGGVGVPPAEDVPDTSTAHRQTINISSLTANGPANFELRGNATVRVITKPAVLYIDVDDLFNPNSPHDDYSRFVPGASLNGRSIDHAIMAGGGQRIKLHVISAPAQSASLQFAFAPATVSRYPGVAMNYPITSPSTRADYSFLDNIDVDELTTTVPVHSTGHTTVTLFVRDYAAKGRLKVTLVRQNGESEGVANKWLPKDQNGTGIPDAGWRALRSSVTGSTNSVEDVYDENWDGEDDPPASGLPAEGIVGDGFTAIEEYRGFVVRNKHRRLRPDRKDLFLVIDPDDDGIDGALLDLPITIHEARHRDALGAFGPIINPNRATIAGSTLQRALRVRNRFPSPDVRRISGNIVPADFDFLGWTFKLGDDLDLIDVSDGILAEVDSPNETMISELFDHAFTRHYISYGPDGILSTTVATTDNDDPDHLVVDGGSNWLQSVPSGDDHYTLTRRTVCGSGEDRPWRVLTTDELLALYEETFLHEAAHGVDVEHDMLNCSQSVMSIESALPVGRRLTADDRAQIRLHRKHQ
jgi:hypothetical protein